MATTAGFLLAGGLCLIAPLGGDSGEGKKGPAKGAAAGLPRERPKAEQPKATPERSAPLVTSDRSAETAASWGAEVLRVVAASEPQVTARQAAHLSTRTGKLSGGGMIATASCRQKFTVAQALAGPGRAGGRDISYSFIESAEGF